MFKSIFLSTDAPSNTKIDASRTNFIVGDIAELTCVSDGNPSPNYTWIFNFTEAVTGTKYNLSGNNSKLSFTANLADNGYYQCVSSNSFKKQTFNSSSYVVLTIQEYSEEKYPLNMEPTCSKKSCSLIQSCVLRNGRAHCSLNIWSVIAFIFIALTVISGAACVSLILSRKPQQKINQTNGIGWVYSDYFHVYRFIRGLQLILAYRRPRSDVHRPSTIKVFRSNTAKQLRGYKVSLIVWFRSFFIFG